MSNSIAPGSSADINVKVTALTTNPNVSAQYKTIILKKNLVNGVNTLTQEMMSATNIKYVIKYDYVLGEDITVPEGCILKFDGGTLINGTIIGKDSIIEASAVKIFNTDTIIKGVWNVRECYAEWFDDITEDIDSSNAINACIDSFNKITLLPKIYTVSFIHSYVGTSIRGQDGSNLPKLITSSANTLLYLKRNMNIENINFKSTCVTYETPTPLICLLYSKYKDENINTEEYSSYTPNINICKIKIEFNGESVNHFVNNAIAFGFYLDSDTPAGFYYSNFRQIIAFWADILFDFNIIKQGYINENHFEECRSYACYTGVRMRIEASGSEIRHNNFDIVHQNNIADHKENQFFYDIEDTPAISKNVFNGFLWDLSPNPLDNRGSILKYVGDNSVIAQRSLTDSYLYYGNTNGKEDLYTLIAILPNNYYHSTFRITYKDFTNGEYKFYFYRERGKGTWICSQIDYIKPITNHSSIKFKCIKAHNSIYLYIKGGHNNYYTVEPDGDNYILAPYTNGIKDSLFPEDVITIDTNLANINKIIYQPIQIVNGIKSNGLITKTKLIELFKNSSEPGSLKLNSALLAEYGLSGFGIVLSVNIKQAFSSTLGNGSPVLVMGTDTLYYGNYYNDNIVFKNLISSYAEPVNNVRSDAPAGSVCVGYLPNGYSPVFKGIDGIWVDALGIETINKTAARRIGSTQERPTSVSTGFYYYDTTISKPIWWTGEKWIDATGATV